MIDGLLGIVDLRASSASSKQCCRLFSILLVALLICFGHWYFLHGCRLYAVLAGFVRVWTVLASILLFLVGTGALACIRPQYRARAVDTIRGIPQALNRMLQLRLTVGVLVILNVVVVATETPSYIAIYNKTSTTNNGAPTTLVAHIQVTTASRHNLDDNTECRPGRYLVHDSSRRMVFWIPLSVGDDPVMTITGKPAQLYRVTRPLTDYDAAYGIRGSHRLVNLDGAVIDHKLWLKVYDETGASRSAEEWTIEVYHDLKAQCNDGQLLSALSLDSTECTSMLRFIFRDVSIDSNGRVKGKEAVAGRENVGHDYAYCYRSAEDGSIALTVKRLDEAERKDIESTGETTFCADAKMGNPRTTWFEYPVTQRS